MPIKCMIRGLSEFQNNYFNIHQEMFRQLSQGQTPEILFIPCSDSRIDLNLLTQTKPGELFIIMKNFLVPQSTDNIFDKISSSIKASNQWFFKTPERALEQAYQAALKIKAIEDEHFSGQKVAATSKIYSQNILSCFQADVDKYLNIIKIKIAEFKVSRLLLRGANYNFLDKLSFIDQILTKYQISAKAKPILKPLSLSEKLVPLQLACHSKSQVKSSEITLIDVKPINQKSGVLPRLIGRTIGKIKTEMNPNSEEE